MGRPWRRGHLQRTWDETNLKGVAPAMRNEHGTDRKRLPRIYRFSAFAPGQPPPVLCGHHGPVAVAELAVYPQSSQSGELPSAADDLPMRRLEAEGEP